MANNGNLIPNSRRSPEEVRENGKKGGIKSGESRRNKKEIRAVVIDALNGKIELSDDEAKLFTKLGMGNENSTVKGRIVAGMILNALKGDMNCIEYLLKISGEDPTMKLKLQELALKKEQSNQEIAIKNRPVINIDVEKDTNFGGSVDGG